MTGRAWFTAESEAEEPPTGEFLQRVRDLAPDALAFRVSAEDTSAVRYAGGCTLMVPVPGIPPSERPVVAQLLQVRYSPGSLIGYWGCSHLFDDFDTDDPEAMSIESDDLSGERAAELAIDWLRQQLDRPLVRREWDRPRGRVAREWTLEDTGSSLGHRGWLPFRQRDPDRVIRLWPPDVGADPPPAL